jgi:small subunit ribosomal protein S14
MARKSLIEKEKRKNKLVKEYDPIRQSLKRQVRMSSSIQEKIEIFKEIQSLPRNSASGDFFDKVEYKIRFI